MDYLGGVAAAASGAGADVASTATSIVDNDPLLGSIVDVGGKKVVVKRKIGEGGFAFVYEAVDASDRTTSFALKRLLAMDAEKRMQIVREISLLKTLSVHSNVVSFVAAAEAKGVSQKGCDEFLVLMEYCPTNLSQLMSKRGPYPPQKVAAIFAQVTSAVAAMHRSQPPVIHRDLKLENLLVDSSGKNLKLCDFGSATTETFTPNSDWTMTQRTTLEEEMARHTTPMYRAPEMLDTWSNYPVGLPSDIWALGCLLYFLCFGRHPFEDSAKLAIINGNYRIPEMDVVYEAFHDLIRQMLVVDPTCRPTCSQVQEHLASVSKVFGYTFGEIDFDLDSQSQSSGGSSANLSPTTETTETSSQTSIMSRAGNFMGKLRDTSKAVIQTVQHSMAARDLDLHLITERVAAMSYPAEGLESAMRNHVDDIAAILESRHAGKYAVINLSERQYSGSRFTTGLVHHAGWSTSKPTRLTKVLDAVATCLDFLRKDPRNVVVIHCLDGRSNTAVLVAALLMVCKFVKSYRDALKFFALKRCEPILEGHHRILLRYLESAYSGPSQYVETRVITITSIVLEPVPLFSKNGDGCRPFIEVSGCAEGSSVTIAPSSEYASLSYFTTYDEDAVLKVNAKADGDVVICLFHARQSLSSLFAHKFDRIPMCKLYFHTGFLAGNTSSLRFKLKDLDGITSEERFSNDFRVVVNFRPEKEVKSTPVLKTAVPDINLLFGSVDDLTNNRDMMGVPEVKSEPEEQPPKAPPRQHKNKSPPLVKTEEILVNPEQQVNNTSVPHMGLARPASDTLLLDLGLDNHHHPHYEQQTSITSTNQCRSTPTAVDALLDLSSNASIGDLLTPSAGIKSSSSAEFNVTNNNFEQQEDPFAFLGMPKTTQNRPEKEALKPASTADELLSNLLDGLEVKTGANNANVNVNSKPNYNSSSFFKTTPNTTGNGSGHVPPKVSEDTFNDLLGGFAASQAANNDGGGKSIGEMKKKEVMKQMGPEEAQVFEWKEGKARNLRALLCSLDTVLWPGSRWTQCGMHQLVSQADVKKMYKKACVAVHPDKQVGTDNEELSKLIFIELNDAWAEFNKDPA